LHFASIAGNAVSALAARVFTHDAELSLSDRHNFDSKHFARHLRLTNSAISHAMDFSQTPA